MSTPTMDILRNRTLTFAGRAFSESDSAMLETLVLLVSLSGARLSQSSSETAEVDARVELMRTLHCPVQEAVVGSAGGKGDGRPHQLSLHKDAQKAWTPGTADSSLILEYHYHNNKCTYRQLFGSFTRS